MKLSRICVKVSSGGLRRSGQAAEGTARKRSREQTNCLDSATNPNLLPHFPEPDRNRGTAMNRRDWIKGLGLGATAGALGGLSRSDAFAAETTVRAAKGSPPVTITKVRAFATRPARVNLIVVKVDTSEPGLYGLGCATFTQRPTPVLAAVNEYLDPFARGRDADNIADL